MLPDGRRLGAHLPLGQGMVRAAERAHEIGATALQVFGDNPTAWRRRPDPPKEAEAFRARVTELGIGPVAIHAEYLVNLAGSDDELYERSIEVLTHELRMAPALGARFVNVHIGSHRGSGPAAGVARVADGGVPGERVAVCLDTAHLWGAGDAIGDRAGVDALLDKVDAQIGLGRLALIHLSDSRAGRGSQADCHEHPGAGRIGRQGLAHLLTHLRLAHVAYVLETPRMDEGYDAVNMARARALAEDRPLEPLPPEALELRGHHRAIGAPAD